MKMGIEIRHKMENFYIQLVGVSASGGPWYCSTDAFQMQHKASPSPYPYHHEPSFLQTSFSPLFQPVGGVKLKQDGSSYKKIISYKMSPTF